MSSCHSRSYVHFVVWTAFCLLLATPFCLSAQTASKNPTAKAGKYHVELRIPTEGVYAREEIDIEFRVTDTSQNDPVLGALAVIKAKVTAVATMPSMKSMPKQNPKTHAEGVPGDYGVVCFFPHGGEYKLDLTITPPEDKPFSVSFKVNVEDEADPKKRKPKPQPFVLKITAEPGTPKAGVPTRLSFVIHSRETGKPVTDYEIVHEQLMHLLIASKDLSIFDHLHPELGKEGVFTLEHTFPSAGEYRLFTDVAPRGAGSQVLMQPLRVEGAPRNQETLKVIPNPAPIAGDAKITLHTPTSALVSGKSLNLKFRLMDTKTNQPVTDIQPWLGAQAHLILIHQNATTFVHSHPEEESEPNAKTVVSGEITFLSRFPIKGLYRGWLQFQRGGTVHTATLVLEVK